MSSININNTAPNTNLLDALAEAGIPVEIQACLYLGVFGLQGEVAHWARIFLSTAKGEILIPLNEVQGMVRAFAKVRKVGDDPSPVWKALIGRLVGLAKAGEATPGSVGAKAYTALRQIEGLVEKGHIDFANTTLYAKFRPEGGSFSYLR